MAAKGRASDPTSEGEGSPSEAEITGKATKLSSKLWLKIASVEGEIARIQIKRKLNVTALRMAVSRKTAVPVNNLQIELDGKILVESWICPFKMLDADTIKQKVVHWKSADRLQLMIKQRKLKHFNARGQFGRTLVHYAVLDGDFLMCQEILDHAECLAGLVNASDIFHDTPVMLAAVMGFPEVVELLLDRQANIERQNLLGRTPLMLASEHGHTEIVRVLMVNNAKVGMPEDSKSVAWSAGLADPDETYFAELNRREGVVEVLEDQKKERAGAATLLDDMTM